MRQLFIFCVFIFCQVLLFSESILFQEKQSTYTKAKVFVDHSQVQANQDLWVWLQLKHVPGWHSYWKNPGESGLATRFQFQDTGTFKVIQQFMGPPQRYRLGDLVNYGYEKEANFLIQLRTNANLNSGKLAIPLQVKWLVCENICVPEEADFELSLQVSDQAQSSSYFDSIQAVKASLLNSSTLKVSATAVDSNILLQLPSSFEYLHEAYFFADKAGDFRVTASQPLLNTKPLQLKLEPNLLASENFSGILMLQSAADAPKQYYQVQASLPKASLSLAWVIVMAFMGGFLLNLMPCVFPVLSLKILAFLKQEKAGSALRNSLYYSVGIFVSFYVLVTVLQFLKLAGQQIGWGFQLQSPLFILALMAVMLTVTMLMSKLSKLSLGLNASQGFFARLVPKQIRSEGASSFFTGVLAVFVATPCTAPFMAPALGYGLSQSLVVNIMVFSALALGMALPFLLLGFLPTSFWQRLPKPGIWMLRIQQILAVPMFLTALWLAWVLYAQVTLTAWLFAMAMMLVLVLFLWDVLPIKTALWKSVPYIVLSSLFFLVFLHFSADSLQKERFSVSALKGLLEKDNPKVFVDVTARWCLTCKVNENLVLNTADIQVWFEENNIQFKVLDWTQQNTEITQYLQSFQREGVPLYIYYDSQGQSHILPQVLSKQGLKAFIQARE